MLRETSHLASKKKLAYTSRTVKGFCLNTVHYRAHSNVHSVHALNEGIGTTSQHAGLVGSTPVLPWYTDHAPCVNKRSNAKALKPAVRMLHVLMINKQTNRAYLSTPVHH